MLITTVTALLVHAISYFVGHHLPVWTLAVQIVVSVLMLVAVCGRQGEPSAGRSH